MAITVDYSPAASQYGGIAFRAGRGRYDTTERRYQDQQRLAVEQLLQRERMQQTEINASAQARAEAIAAQERAGARQLFGNIAGQAMQQYGRERLASFGAIADERRLGLSGQIQGDLQRQQYDLLGQRDQAQAELQRQAEQARLDDRLDFDLRQREQEAARIDAEAERRVAALRGQIGSGLRAQDAERRIAQIYDEAGAAKAGVEFNQGSLGPTPKEVLEGQWQDSVLQTPGGPVYQTEDGEWSSIRGYQAPDDPMIAQQKQQQEAQKAEFAREKHEADLAQKAAELRAKAAEYAMKLMDKTKKTGEGLDAQEVPLYTPEQAEEMANRLFGIAEAGAQAVENTRPSGPLPDGSTVDQPGVLRNPVASPGQGSVGPIPAAVPGEGSFDEADAPAGDPSAQRQPITSFDALNDVAWQDMGIGGQRYSPPTDLGPVELKGVGTTANFEQVRDARGPAAATSWASLRDRFVALPEGDGSLWQRRSLSVVMGAVAAYGHDPNQWPPEVRQQIAAEAAEVNRILSQGSSNGRPVR